ncbi:conserved exported protein of unknown function [Tenacibaculum sp. 190524A02b]|uniref:hypothetical protein n=1 Tax=Tenacibaculum vairaonense TaxID=3137860 RepID=UPI0032B1D0C5
MRTGIFLLIALMSLGSINANNINKSTSKIGVTYRNNEAVTFVERGVQFHVFLNGDFDFNTNYRDTRYVDYYGRRSRVNRGVRIERDRDGKVRRIGNVFVNYDYWGNVTRIGSVFIKYRRGQLDRVGNLRVRYDRWGNPIYRGYVKNVRYYNDYDGCSNDVNIDINIGDIYDYDDVYFYRRDFRRNYRKFREDNNFYYYRAVPNAKTGKRGKVLKRRKSKRNNGNQYYKKTTPEQTGRSKRNR